MAYTYTNNNECQAEDGLNFNFSYDSTSGKHGYTDSSGAFIPFESGGTDVSDTTATAATVRSGYYFYNAQGERTLGTYTGIDTSDATAKAKNIEAGYTAYVKGSKITGTAIVTHTITKYTGSVPDLGQGRTELGATSIGGYALFAGGYSRTESSWVPGKIVYAYNESLVRSSPVTFTYTETDKIEGTHIGNYALFKISSYVCTINKDSLSASYVESYYSYDYGATNVGNYAIFAGGTPSGNYNSSLSTVEAFNSSLTKSIPETLSVARDGIASTTIGNYALFGGGWKNASTSIYYNTVEAYNYSLTKRSVDGLTQNSYKASATNIKNYYAIFAGGSYSGSGSSILDTVNTYDSSLTRSTGTSLSAPRKRMAATTLGNYAIFAGGQNYNGTEYWKYTDVYDNLLTKTNVNNLTYARYNHAAASVGDYAIFAGGYGNIGGNYDNYLAKAEAYYLS